jgi:hypothetical protein
MAIVGLISRGVGFASKGVGKIAESSAKKDSRKDEVARLIQFNCGKKRKIWFSKSKKTKWEDCSRKVQEKYDLEKSKDRESNSELERQKSELEKQKAELGKKEEIPTENIQVSDKFLGMPKAVGITVAIVGGLALVVGGIFLVKKLRK